MRLAGLCRPLFALALIGASPTPARASDPVLSAPQVAVDRADLISIAAIDPLRVADDDFARLRDPAVWQTLSVYRIGLREGETAWRLWRIASRRHRPGPLWVVPHDNENAAFAAAVDAVRSWGGVAIIIDTGPADRRQAARFNRDTPGGIPIDPNRHFRVDHPIYTGQILDDLKSGLHPVIALHTNAPGFDPALPACPGQLRDYRGSGDISIGLCSDRFHPRPSVTAVWPFDDGDTLALTPYRADMPPDLGHCVKPMASADFNLVFERVGDSDGSLSNYAALHGIEYLNFETRDRGDTTTGFADARRRLTAMIDAMMERCAPITGIALRPSPTARGDAPGRAGRQARRSLR